jgi:proteasome lid subunit RPN8/RPN11
MVLQARQGAPDEVGGVLASANGRAMNVFRARNAADNPTTGYRMATEDQRRILAEIDEKGLDIFAVYHSHPTAPAYPTTAELSGAYYSNAYYLVLSLADPIKPTIRAYRIDQGRGDVIEFPVEVN